MRLGSIRVLTCLAVVSLAVVSQATQYSRVVHKQAQPLNLEPGTVAVYMEPGVTSAPPMPDYVQGANTQPEKGALPGQWYVRIQGHASEDLVSDFAKMPGVAYVAPVFRSKNDHPILFNRKIYLKMAQGVSQDQGIALVNSLHIGTATKSQLPGVILLQPSSKNGFTVLQQANTLAWRSDVKYATANTFFCGSKSLVPNDPFYPLQWAFRNTGQIAGFGTDPVLWRDFNVQPAWDITLGSPNIKILVLDDGVDLTHPDINRAEAKEFTSDPGNGGPLSNKDNHGTMVAGCITSITNNNVGVAGVAGGCKTVSARVNSTTAGDFSGFSNDPFTTFATQEDWTANALLWGQTVGCKVSNNSNIYDIDSDLITDMYLLTRLGGMIHFAAAGNAGDTTLPYPASDDSVDSVTGIDDQGFQFGTTGDGIDYCMPAVRILTTDRVGNKGIDPTDYIVDEFFNPFIDQAHIENNMGTSYSSAFAAGVAALMLSVNPNLNADQIDEILHATCVDMLEPPTETDRLHGYDNKWGWGLINAGQAVANAGYQGVTLDQSTVRGGTKLKGTVKMLYPVATDTVARLSSSNIDVANFPRLPFPQDTIVIPAGQLSARFNLETYGVNIPFSVVLTASVNNVDRTATINVLPPTIASITFTQSTTTGGNTMDGTVKTGGVGGPNGCVVQLKSDGAAAKPPASVMIATAKNSVNFQMTTYKVSVTTTRTITATTDDGKSKTTQVTLTPVVTEINSFTLTPGTVEGGKSSTGKIILTAAAPIGGIFVKVSDTSSLITTPPTVAFAQGDISHTFTATTKETASSTSGTISTKYDTSTRTATLFITPTQKIVDFTANPSAVTGGFNAKVRLELYAAAGPGGLTVTLVDFSSAANTPPSVYFGPGYKFKDILIPTVPVTQNTSVRVRATLPNGSFKDVVFTVTKL